MATHILIYNAALCGMCVYAAWQGGGPERLAAFGWGVACLATLLMPFDPNRTFHSVDLPRTAIDVAVLIWFVGIAAAANRFWPIWLAALHLIGVSVHGVKAYQPDLLPSLYAVALGKIAYPILGVMAAGTWRHHARVLRVGRYRDWSFAA